MTVLVEKAGLRLGDRIAYELPIDFGEQDIVSLEIDQRPANEAKPGMEAGIKTSLHKDTARKGTRVFRLST